MKGRERKPKQSTTKDTKGREGKPKQSTTKDTKGHEAKQALDAPTPHGVIPAQAGIHFDVESRWILACARMTSLWVDVNQGGSRPAPG
jgi:hypothetical protein